MKKIVILFVLALAVCFTGCTRQGVTNMHNMVYGNSTIGQVEQCIATGAVRTGWNIKMVKPGLFEAAYYLNDRDGFKDAAAFVEIAYTRESYHIYYKKSVNFLHTQSLNTIHKEYNKLVRELDGAIQYELASAELDERMVRGVYQLMDYDSDFN